MGGRCIEMLIIDTHCHTALYWFEPIEILVAEMKRNDVDKAVLVQASWLYDNTYLIDCMYRFPGSFSVVVAVDTNETGAPEALEKWVTEGAEGIRLSSTARSPGSDPLAIWRKAAQMGIVVSVGGPLNGFISSEFESIIREFPNLKIIIEHLGWGGTDRSPGRADYRKVLELARFPNTFMKVPGFGELFPRPEPFRQPFPFEDMPPLIEMAIDAFGVNRLMWGSDFPPVASREGYTHSLRFPMEHVSFRSEEDKEWVFGKTASSLWKFGND